MRGRRPFRMQFPVAIVATTLLSCRVTVRSCRCVTDVLCGRHPDAEARVPEGDRQPLHAPHRQPVGPERRRCPGARPLPLPALAAPQRLRQHRPGPRSPRVEPDISSSSPAASHGRGGTASTRVSISTGRPEEPGPVAVRRRWPGRCIPARPNGYRAGAGRAGRAGVPACRVPGVPACREDLRRRQEGTADGISSGRTGAEHAGPGASAGRHEGARNRAAGEPRIGTRVASGRLAGEANGPRGGGGENVIQPVVRSQQGPRRTYTDDAAVRV